MKELRPAERRLLVLVKGSDALGESAGGREAATAVLAEIYLSVGWVVRSALRQHHVRDFDGVGEEDIVAEIVTSLVADDCRALSAFKPSSGTLKNYVGTRAGWVCQDLWRKHDRRRVFRSMEDVGDPPSLAYSPEEVVRGREATVGVRAHVLAKISATERLAFAHHYDDELPSDEVRRIMGWSPGQMHNFRYRVRLFARAYLRDDP